MDENMECQYHNQCGGWCETEEERDQCLCCDCLDAEREEDAERQHAVELGKAMQRIACAAGIELMQPKEVADIVCGRLQWVDDELLNALKKRCYILSESHLSGYRLILGFNTLDDVQGAHQQIVKSRAIRPREVQSTKGRDRTKGEQQ